MATNEEKLPSAFQEKVSIRSIFYFGKYVQLYQLMTWLAFGSKQFQNGRLVVIFSFNKFVIFT